MVRVNPQTLVRAGRFDDSLESAVNKSTENLKPIPFGLGNTVKYGIFSPRKEGQKSGWENESYLLMVSQQINKAVAPVGYNVLLTVTSYSEEKARQVAEQFERETGITLNIEPPNAVKAGFSLLTLTFVGLEKNPALATLLY